MSNKDINDILNVQDTSVSNSEVKKYPALRTISGIISVIAYIVLISTIVFAAVGISYLSLLITLGVIIIGVILFISLLASSEIIKVFIDIEENTRLTLKK